MQLHRAGTEVGLDVQGEVTVNLHTSSSFPGLKKFFLITLEIRVNMASFH